MDATSKVIILKIGGYSGYLSRKYRPSQFGLTTHWQNTGTKLISMRGFVRPSVRQSVRPSVPCYFRKTNMAVLKAKVIR